MSTVDSIFSIVIFHICMSVFDSTLLSFANPSRNWTFQRFARVAEKERNGKKEEKDTRYDLNPEQERERRNRLKM